MFKAQMFKAIAAGAAGLLVLMLAFSTYYTVDQGERAVVLHYGAIAGVDGPGLHFKLPFVTTIAKISVQTQKDGFEQNANGDQRMEAYTADQQPTHVSVAITYRVTDPAAVYANYGDIPTMEARLINPRAYEQVKNVFGQFDAISAVQKRTQLDALVARMIRQNISGPLVIDSVQIEDIAFSPEYEQAVEQRMQAIVAQERAVAEKQQRITNADAAAYEVKAQADAQAHQIQVQGDAEAQAIKARGDALRENPGLVALTTAEKWDGHLPQTMIPGNGLPFLNVGH